MSNARSPGPYGRPCTWGATLSGEWKGQVVPGASVPGTSADPSCVYTLVRLLFHQPGAALVLVGQPSDPSENSRLVGR